VRSTAGGGTGCLSAVLLRFPNIDQILLTPISAAI
jgi:hypothetical protein